MRTVMLMSQCFSGTFASAALDGETSEPSGDVCGFFSTTRDLPAYGCYPEGRDRDRIGHAFRFIEALGHHTTTSSAHLEVLVTDGTPDVPLRTSDSYLERLVAAEAASRDLPVDDLVDLLLKEAWRDRGAWESEIRLLDRLGDAFGTFSPRSLGELETYDDELQPLIEQMETYADRWELALVGVKSENLTAFLGERPDWKKQLEVHALAGLDGEDRVGLLKSILPQIESHARENPKIWRRLNDLRDRARRASEAHWRLEVRRGALRRMRSILVGIAGRVLLAPEAASEEDARRRSDQRRALDDLERCESFAPGEPVFVKSATQDPVEEAFPPLRAELQILQEVLPSWLGVRFGQVPEPLLADRDLPGGASWLAAVFPDSPATDAGLEPGDIVLGTPDRPFTAIGQIREWTMTSPRDTPLQLVVLRPAQSADQDLEYEATLRLRPYPLEWPKLPEPPQVGDLVPSLPDDLEPLGQWRPNQIADGAHLLFFWATWCIPCKAAVPEMMAFAEDRGAPVLAISDEDAATVAGFLDKREKPFFEQVAVDPLRRSFISYGVSGTPTIILVDEDGIIRHRQVGYSLEKGITVEGWSWTKP